MRRYDSVVFALIFVLSTVVPSTLRAQSVLPPAASASAEEQFEGELEVQYEDFEGGARLLHFLHTNGRRLRLELSGQAPGLLSGARVRARGRLQNDTLALSSGSTLQALSLASSNTFGAQSTVVILVNFQNNTSQPYTPAYAYDQTFASTSAFYRENSYQQTSLVGAVFGWYTIAMSNTSCDTNSLASLADQAATAHGANLSAYTHKIYGFPNTAACSWWGLGSVGGNPSRAWINGAYSTRVVSHEFGHNLGDYHSHSESCDSVSCSTWEYGDEHDTMGSILAHLNAFQKERLGWLNYGVSPALTTVSATGSYWVEAYETMAGGNKGLKILRSSDPTTGAKTWYYVEARTNFGFDSGVARGVLLHTGAESSGNSSYEKDVQPLTTTFDPVLDPGQTFTDATLGVTIATVTADSTGALVNVTFTPKPCVAAPPMLTMSPGATQWAQPGRVINYTVSVTNNDGSGCSASTFNLTSALPGLGWLGSFGLSSLTIDPGLSRSTSFALTSAAGTSGSYGFSVSTTHGSVKSVSGSVMIVAQLDTVVTTDRSSYTKNTTILITTFVGAGSSPLAGASVTVTVYNPLNGTTTMSATTAGNGYAVVKYRLRARDVIGQYRAVANSTYNGIPGTGSATFTMQ